MRSRRHGVIGIVVIITALATTGLAYVAPIGQVGYTAHLSNSGGLRPGDEVRIAGVPVGKVTGVRLDHTVVAMTFDVKSSVPVGADSTLDIKLLTPLGGHYVALDPQGAAPLGHNVIPPERVTTPFEINEIIQAATPLVQEVDGRVIHDTFTEVANAAERYPDALRDVIGSAHQLTTALRRSTSDFHRGLDFTNNTLHAMVDGRRQLVDLAEQFARIGTMYTSKAVDIVEFFTLLDELARIIDRAVTFYGREVMPVVNGIDDIFDALFAHPDRIGKAAIELGQILQIVWPMLSGNGVVFDQHNRLAPGQDLCLPNIMKHC
ncbi:MlaD family protein [[Mycobacterium] nativiensis]|uniref:MlaD family protein n=1 Tax=[Mycobacterium] nativiensis TaxID=2855503 RepID=A0ABU5XZ69_9MYCO|nr:MlaD family protein [Mycolicibacter sp. MYC340]MEB3031985.1 MlaD family protein [Mycolicibacter sp. MYC340]